METTLTFPVSTIVVPSDGAVVEELETADTIKVPAPIVLPCDDDDEGPTGVYWVPRG